MFSLWNCSFGVLLAYGTAINLPLIIEPQKTFSVMYTDCQPGTVLLPKEHLAMSGDVSDCHNLGGDAIGM